MKGEDFKLPVSIDAPPQALPVTLGMPAANSRDYSGTVGQEAEQMTSSVTDEGPAYKPFSFALRPAPDDQIHIRYGVLIHQINKMLFDTDGLVTQVGVSDPVTTIPQNFIGEEGNRYLFATLEWRGNVYLYWETDSTGSVTFCDIRGPEKPTSQALPNPLGGKFSFLIGTVNDYDIPTVDQNLASDFFWITAFGENDGSAGSDSSTSTSTSTSTSDSGSDKSTAIVPMPWHQKGYGAMFTMESNEVLFEFVVRDIPITGKTTVHEIDHRYLHVCEPNSLCVAGAPSGDKPSPIGASVNGNQLTLRSPALPFLRSTKATVKLTGVRKGFAGYDMPERSRRQFVANEKFINSAYPKE